MLCCFKSALTQVSDRSEYFRSDADSAEKIYEGLSLTDTETSLNRWENDKVNENANAFTSW